MSSSTDENTSPSDKSSDSGSAGQPWGSTGGSLDSEEEEIVAEIREVWRMSTVSYSVNEDSSDSIDAEEVAQIKEKLRALRRYVSELQASYDELLGLFSQHESSASECRANLEKKLEDALNQAKFYQKQCQLLENELTALQHDTSGTQPAGPQSPLGKELANDLQNISSGLQTKMNRLSQLTRTSCSPTGQKSPSERKRLTSEGSEEDDEDPLPKHARQYTAGPRKTSPGTQQGEEEALQTSIGSWDLEGIDEDSVLGQLLEKECQVTLLQTRVQDLEHQLQEAQRDHRLMATSLSATQLELQDQSVSEKEANVKNELADLRAERDRLAAEVKDSYRSVSELTAAKDAAMESVSDLQQQLDTMKDKLTNQESQTTNQLHDSLETRSSDRESSTCEADRASLEEAQQRVCGRCTTIEKTVHTLEDKLRTAEDEAQSLQNEILRKKGEMARLMSSIQLARAQIGTMHKRLRQSGNDSLGSSHDSEASSEQLTAAERASEALEESMTQHMSLWDQLCDSVESHQTTVSALQDKHTELVAEVHEREARVLQLEALLQAGDVSNASGTRTLKDLSASVIMLKAELAKTKEEAQHSQEEFTSLLRVLGDSLNVVTADRSMLSAAVNDRDSQLSKVQQDYRELSELYYSSCAQATTAEAAKQLAEQRLREANNDLSEHSQLMADLEADLIAERKGRELDLELTTISLYSLRDKLASVVLMNTDGGKAGVQDQLSQRDALLATLQEQTAQLLQQYQQSSLEVNERQQLVRSLETDLLSSQALCDSLQQQISDGEIRAKVLQQELTKSESERFQLSEQLQVLQGEAENACHDLERSLRHSKLVTQQSKDHIESLDQQLAAEREVSSHLMDQLHSLKLTQSEGESELEHIQRMMDELRHENEQLHSNNQRQRELIVSLQTRVEILEGDEERLEGDERLREQLALSDEERREVEKTAMKRLDDIILLKTQLEDANHVITDMKVERLGLVHSSQDSRQRILELEETLSSLSLQMKQKEEVLFYQKSSGDASSAFIQQKLEECREELHRCQLRAAELDRKYQSTLEELAATRTRLSDGGDLFSMTEEDASVKILQERVCDYQKELREKERKLEKTEQERLELLLRIGELSADHSGSDAESSLPPSLVGEAAATSGSVRVNLPSSYQQTLEKGLVAGSVLDTSGYSSPVESPDSLDKAYWVKRAAELSVQLQQSTQYWSSKVRAQELQLQNTSSHNTSSQ